MPFKICTLVHFLGPFCRQWDIVYDNVSVVRLKTTIESVIVMLSPSLPNPGHVCARVCSVPQTHIHTGQDSC